MKNLISIVMLAIVFYFPCFGQQFSFHSNSPFGIKTIRDDSTRNAQRIMFFDYDNDGDLDLILTGLDYIDNVDPLTWSNIHSFMEVQENIGDKWHPQFGDRMQIYEAFPFPLGYFFPSVGDINGDSRPDFIVNGIVDYIGNRTLTYCRNTGQPGVNEFEVTRFDSMGLNDFVPESFFIPELVDLDGDGDLDLLMSGFDPAFAVEDGPDVPVFYYAKNFGTTTQPDLQGWYQNPYGLEPSPLSEFTTSGDIDNDGDVDVLGAPSAIPADSNNYLLFHQNTPGPNGKPSFSTILNSPFGLPVTHGEELFIFPTLVDIDGDGDLDLFVFQGTQSTLVLKYYQNGLCASSINEVAVNLCDGDSLVVGGNVYYTEGDYTIELQGANGCDSVILLSITSLPTYSVSLNESICDGEVYIIGNETFSTSGDYTVFLSAENGCDSVINLSLEVHENPTTNLDETLCEGETYHVGNEEFTTSGHYEVVLASQEGCDSTISLNLAFFQIDTTVNVVQNTMTSNHSGASYQWFNCDTGENIPGATGQSFTATVTGNYAVRISDGPGCTSVSACTSIVITSIAESAILNGIRIYPNPSNGLIYFKNDTSYPVTSFTLTNLSGQLIREISLNSKNSADLSCLGKGFYIVKFKIKGLEISKKLIII